LKSARGRGPGASDALQLLIAAAAMRQTGDCSGRKNILLLLRHLDGNLQFVSLPVG
jgi:hypothetical protein